MALVLGTSSGFVTVAPTTDPTGGSPSTIDSFSYVTKDTSPADSVRITEIGWYRDSGSVDSNFEVALYAADGAVEPGEAGTRLFVSATNSPGTTTGWKTVAVDWAITELTDYWLAIQMDAHAASSDIDRELTGGAGFDRVTQAGLPDPYGGGAVGDTDGMIAVYALVEIDAGGTVVKDIIGGGIIPFAR